MYSASVDDVDTVGCLAVMKLMRAPSTITQLPERLPVNDVMGPVRVRDDGHVALVLGGVVSQLEHEADLHGCLEVAKDSDESIPVNLGGIRR
jgi:hypothetical protein